MTSPPNPTLLPSDPVMLTETLVDWMLDQGAPPVTYRTAKRRMLALLDVLPLTSREALVVRYDMLRPEKPSERAMRLAANDRREAARAGA